MRQSVEVALAEFAESRDEADFRNVVDELGGLVLHAALRRTGDRGLAEEVLWREASGGDRGKQRQELSEGLIAGAMLSGGREAVDQSMATRPARVLPPAPRPAGAAQATTID